MMRIFSLAEWKTKPTAFFREHAVGAALAVVIGAIIAAPPVIFQLSDNYRGFPMMKTNTEMHYVTQVKEVYDGHYGLGNPFFADLKDAPYLFPPLSPTVMGWFGKIFHLDIMTNIMLFRFLATSAMAFFVYLFAAALSQNKLVGYIAAPFVMLGYSLVDPGHIATIIRGRGIPKHAGFLDYGRPVNPQVSSLIFFSYMYFFWRGLQKDTVRWWRHAVIAGILLGSAWYAYLFTWTFIFSFNGFLLLLSAIKKDWERVKRILFVSGIGAVLGIPYLLHVREASSHPWYAESAPRFGFVRMRELQVSRLMLGLLVPFLLSYRRFHEPARQFFVAFFLTAFFVANEQTITGLYVFNHHYHWYYTTPLAVILVIMIAYAFRPSIFDRSHRERSLAFLWAGLLLAYGVLTQRAAYARALPEVIAEQKYAPLIVWLNTETPKDSTVFSHTPLTDFITALTHNNVDFTGTSMYTLVPNERLFHQYLLHTYLEGVPAPFAREYFESHRDAISGFVYGYTYSFLPGVCYGCFPDSVIDDLTEKYANLNDENFPDALRRYPVDYLVWDMKKNPAWMPDRFGFPRVAAFGDIIVYDVRPDASAQQQTYYPGDESGQTFCSAGYCESDRTRASKIGSGG